MGGSSRTVIPRVRRLAPGAAYHRAHALRGVSPFARAKRSASGHGDAAGADATEKRDHFQRKVMSAVPSAASSIKHSTVPLAPTSS